MKKKLLVLILGIISNTASFAFDYETARLHAWYLTDKMAYELDLTQEQCDYVYQINLNYFLQVSSPSDLYGRVVTCRNEDLGYVLTAAQYTAYQGRNYFEKPLNYTEYGWLFPVLEYYEQDAYFLSESAPAYYGNIQGTSRLRSYNEQSPFRSVCLSEDTGLRSGNIQRGFGQNRNGMLDSSGSSSNSRFNQNQDNSRTFGNNDSYGQSQNGSTGTHPNRFQNHGNSNGGASGVRSNNGSFSSQSGNTATHPNRFQNQGNSNGGAFNARSSNSSTSSQSGNTTTHSNRFQNQGNSNGGASNARSNSGSTGSQNGSTVTHPNRFGGQATDGNNGHSGNMRNSGSSNSRFNSSGTSSNSSSSSQSGSNGTGNGTLPNRFKR